MQIDRRHLLLGVSTLAMAPPNLASALARPNSASPALPRPFTPPEPNARTLDLGWRFHLGDIPLPKPLTHRGSYDSVKSGNATGAAAHSYDDSNWRQVDLPHDWAIEAPPVQAENLAQGYRVRGIGWYRRTFRLDPNLSGRYLELQFEAIATNATVWFNGDIVAHNWSGYTSISIDITSLAVFGTAINTIAIRVDADTIEGWWYEGAGIYRHTWLVDRGPVYIVTDGIHADPRQDALGAWTIPIDVTLSSIEQKSASIDIRAELLDDQGATVAHADTTAKIESLETTVVHLAIAGITPRLWSVDDPTLYSIRIQVSRDGVVLDERTHTCGFRTLRFDADRGFFLNGTSLKIKGVCLHQDHAGVGVAVPDALVFWRVQQLKAMGCNAIRSAHNAPGTALLDACDRLGVLVLNENRHFNVTPDYVAQLEWLVRRDRNRPSVILWSIFNEEPSEGTRVGFEMARRLVSVVKRLDDSRPVTAAMSGGLFMPVNVGQAVDVVGFNYQQASYDRYHAENPHVAIVSSEDTSAYMTRGEWTTDRSKRILGSDDNEFAAWGGSQRASWKAVDTRAFVAGGFVWTGFDYHGEPTPFDWPAKSSSFGVLDLCGFPKSAFYIRQALWVTDSPILQILPHWNWTPGDMVKVCVATNLERVQLFLKGHLVGDGVPEPYDYAAFQIPFSPGRLEARGWRGGKIVATHTVETAGSAVHVKLTASRDVISGDGVDALPIKIEVLDKAGRTLPAANIPIELIVDNGRLIGVGNGNPASPASGKESQVTLFNGLAQAIIQTAPNSQGKLTVWATSAGVAPAKLELQVRPVSVPTVPPGPERFPIKGWRQSPLASETPGVPAPAADNDMNSWTVITPGVAPPFSPADGYITLMASMETPHTIFKAGGILIFERINGAGELWVNQQVIASKTDPSSSELRATIAPVSQQLDIALILHAAPSLRTGIPGLVFLEPLESASASD